MKTRTCLVKAVCFAFDFVSEWRHMIKKKKTLKMLWASLLMFEETLLYADSSVYKEQQTTNAQADLHLCCSQMA